MGELSKSIITRKIIGEEDYKPQIYPCTEKKWTGGVGINLEARPMPIEVLNLWAELKPEFDLLNCSEFVKGIHIAKSGLPHDVWDLWFELIIDGVINGAANMLHDHYDVCFGDQPEDCQIVIVDCCYQIGIDGFSLFRKTIGHIKNMDYMSASIELMNSKYARQTPERAERNRDLLIGCGCKL